LNESLSATLANWSSSLEFQDLPPDIVSSTKLRVLDTIGLALAGADTMFGRSVRNAAVTMSPSGACRILGSGERVSLTAAAFANGACSQALEYDDTHNESIVHMSSPAVAAALGLAEIIDLTGEEFITAVALGNEISCRIGSVSPGQFHRRGFHPTGLFATFGVAYLASWVLQLDPQAITRAVGISGSFASGLLECWVDGTQSKFLHAGWAAQSGMTAAFLARANTSGPATVLEGRFGFFASHLQDPTAPLDFARITSELGKRWESRNSSFKPFPAAHVLHPYIDAVLRLRQQHELKAADVVRIDCPVAGFIVPIVCEPTAEKLAPASDSHGRVSLQYSLAEALYFGELGKNAYSTESLQNRDILDLAGRVHYHIDPEFPGPGRFKGAVRITLKDGRSLMEIQEHNRGSAQNPMTREALRAKFDENASGFLSPAGRERLASEIDGLERLPDASTLVGLAVAATD
jgi:2-methylcitrate dehydratase PrpD